MEPNNLTQMELSSLIQNDEESNAPVKTFFVKSVGDYLRHIQSCCQDDVLTLFRGQNQDWPLRPKVSRIKAKGDIQECEKRMLADLQRRSLPFLASALQTEWDWLALAQHHGMATRLLDWTTNPLAALWFSVEAPAVKKNPLDETNHALKPGVIWIYTPREADIISAKRSDDMYGDKEGAFAGTVTRVFQPAHISNRIVAQSGWFTVHKLQPASRQFVALNTLTRAKPLLTKLIVPGKHFAKLRRELDRCGVSTSSIYPDIEGLCKHIESLHTYYSDEDAPVST